jgi:hypothetical protein
MVDFIRKVDKIDQLIARLEPEVGMILGKAAHDGFGLSSQMVPVDTGNLKNSGQIDGRGTEWTITYSTEYAIYVHEGTHRMTARPFLRNACLRQVPSMRAAFAQLEGRLL